MKLYSKKILKLITPVARDNDFKIIPASKEHIDFFTKKAKKLNVPQKAIKEIVLFYEVSNGFWPGLDKISLPHEDDMFTFFEFWEDQKVLWLGTVNMDLIRWHDHKFKIGSALHESYDSAYVFDNLHDLLRKGFTDWL